MAENELGVSPDIIQRMDSIQVGIDEVSNFLLKGFQSIEVNINELSKLILISYLSSKKY